MGPHSCLHAKVSQETTRASEVKNIYSTSMIQHMPAIGSEPWLIKTRDLRKLISQYIPVDDLYHVLESHGDISVTIQKLLQLVDKFNVDEERQLTKFLIHTNFASSPRTDKMSPVSELALCEFSKSRPDVCIYNVNKLKTAGSIQAAVAIGTPDMAIQGVAKLKSNRTRYSTRQ